MTNNKRPRRIPDDPAEAYTAALKTALNIVGFKDNTEEQIRDKLTERGYRPETVGEVLSFLVGKGYVDETRMLERTVHLLAEGRGYGRRRIREELKRMKFRREVLEAFDGWEDIDFVSICRKLIGKRGGARDDKTYAFLLRRGHRPEDIKNAFSEEVSE